MTNRKALLSLLIVGLLLGCGSTAYFEKGLNSWIGQDIRVLEKAWKNDLTEIRIASNGNKIYAFDVFHRSISPGACIVLFEVGGNQKIIAWYHEGNYCKDAPSIL